MKEKGFVQLYRGDGRGKTSIAVGLTVRAVGAGYKVFFCQFLKKGQYSEIVALKKLSKKISNPFFCKKAITIEQYGEPSFIRGEPSKKDVKNAQEGYKSLKKALFSGLYDVVVADEIMVALELGLVSEDSVIELIENKSPNTEFILTGRYTTDAITQKIDLVSDIKEVKHYFKDGVCARIGFEM